MTKNTRPLPVITGNELYWAAALFEGEGCCDLASGKYPRIRLEMSDRDVVGRFASLIGVDVRLSLQKRSKPMFHAECSGPRAVAVMEQLLPIMGARRSAKMASILSTYYLRDSVRSRMPGPALSQPPAILRAA